jgi:2-methylisocitrate lyase-like PEP mutase family enzyme
MVASLSSLVKRGGIPAPGVCDPFTARLVERAGFELLYLGGNALGLSLAKGQPLVTLTETVSHASAIVRTSGLPLIVDAGAGFGAAPHVHRTVLEIESTGAAALHIDDQPYPKSPSYHRGHGGLAPLDSATAKLKVAVNARRNREFLIFARTDALRVTASVEETIKRARAYKGAGIDALIVLDLQPHLVEPIRHAVPDLPLIWIGGVVPPVPSLAELKSAGFAIALYPFNTIAAIAESVSSLWQTFSAQGRPLQSDALLKRMRPELADVAGMRTYWDIEDELNTDGKIAT